MGAGSSWFRQSWVTERGHRPSASALSWALPTQNCLPSIGPGNGLPPQGNTGL